MHQEGTLSSRSPGASGSPLNDFLYPPALGPGGGRESASHRHRHHHHHQVHQVHQAHQAHITIQALLIHISAPLPFIHPLPLGGAASGGCAWGAEQAGEEGGAGEGLPGEGGVGEGEGRRWGGGGEEEGRMRAGG